MLPQSAGQYFTLRALLVLPRPALAGGPKIKVGLEADACIHGTSGAVPEPNCVTLNPSLIGLLCSPRHPLFPFDAWPNGCNDGQGVSSDLAAATAGEIASRTRPKAPSENKEHRVRASMQACGVVVVRLRFSSLGVCFAAQLGYNWPTWYFPAALDSSHRGLR